MLGSSKSILIIASSFVIAIALVAGTYWWLNRQQADSPNPWPSQTSKEVTMQGQLVCLPKKGDGPHTMECAYGLISEGKYYGLESEPSDSFNLFDYTFEDMLEVTGTLSSPEEGTTYDIEGVIKVKSVSLISGQS